MTILIPNVAEVIALGYFVNKTGVTENLILHTFSNNITPAETDTTATYTETAGGGSAASTLTGSSWTITGGNPTSGVYAQQTQTYTGTLTTNPNVYGYYYTQATSTVLMGAELFGTPFTPANSGDTLKITPQITAE